MGQRSACWVVKQNRKENRAFPMGVALLVKKQVAIIPHAPLAFRQCVHRHLMQGSHMMQGSDAI